MLTLAFEIYINQKNTSMISKNFIQSSSELLFQVMSIGLRRLSSDSVVQFLGKKSAGKD